MGVTKKKRTFCWVILNGFAAITLCASSLTILSTGSAPLWASTSTVLQQEPSSCLREIYDEVMELGRHGDDNFIKREFHLNLDGNESNKEEHVVVLNHSLSGREMMLLQVTYFESRRQNSPVKYAKSIREIECFIMEEGIEIRRSDYDTSEIRTLLPNILRGIRETKKHLNLIR